MPSYVSLWGLEFPWRSRLIALLLIFLWLAITQTSLETGGRTLGLLTIIRVALFLVLVLVLLTSVIVVNPNAFGTFSIASPSGFGGIVVAMAFLFVVFQGLEAIAQTSDQIKSPSITIPRGILLSLMMAVLLYAGFLAATLSTAAVAPVCDQSALECLSAQQPPELGVLLVERNASLLGGAVYLFMLVVALLFAVSALFASLTSSTRACLSMGWDGTSPSFFGKTSRKDKSPLRAMAASAALATLFSLTNYRFGIVSGSFQCSLLATLHIR